MLWTRAEIRRTSVLESQSRVTRDRGEASNASWMVGASMSRLSSRVNDAQGRDTGTSILSHVSMYSSIRLGMAGAVSAQELMVRLRNLATSIWCSSPAAAGIERPLRQCGAVGGYTQRDIPSTEGA